MSDTNIGLLITAVAGIISAMITASITAYSRIKVERIKADKDLVGKAELPPGELPAGEQPGSPGISRIVRKINWKVTGVITAVTVVTTLLVLGAVALVGASRSSTVALDSLTSSIFAFSGSGGTGECYTFWGAMSVLREEDFGTGYKLDYFLPAKGCSGYAGLVFQFPEPKDLTAYQSMEFMLRFSDNQTRCELVMTDTNGTRASIRLGDNIPPIDTMEVTTYREGQKVRIPLAAGFSSLNLRFVNDITYGVNSDISEGTHYFIVSDINFLK